VDLRSHSPTYCQWFGAYLSETNCRQLYIPPGLAHGFCATSEVAELLYKCTDYYYPQHERTILWNDPELAIDWPVTQPLLSEKDRRGLPLHTAPVFEDIPVEG
jgi:dTDP-4-dehydrorhamnose 3,5-epimerase